MDISSLFSPRLQISTTYGHAKHFIVVGAGGTGGYLIPHLARQIKLQNDVRALEGHRLHTMTVIDGDVVEQKNLIRQNFVGRDIEKNKAEVMATRYGAAYGITINYITDYITATEMLTSIAADDEIPVYVDCVDNNKTRVFLQEGYRQASDFSYFISSGNEEMTGQVVLSMFANPGRHYDLNQRFKDGDFNVPMIVSTPSVLDMFPSMLDGSDKLPTEMSCAENAESAPQNVHTNQTAANLIFGFLNKLLAKPKDLTKGIDHFAIFYNLNNMNFRTLATTKEDFVSALKMTENNPALPSFLASEGEVKPKRKPTPRKRKTTAAVEAEVQSVEVDAPF